MLQLLPALVLLMLHGPSTLQRSALADKLPESIRLMVELRQPEEDSDADSRIESADRLCELLRSNVSPVELSAAIACFLGLAAQAPMTPCGVIAEPHNVPTPTFDDPPFLDEVAAAKRSHPCRAGPLG